MNVYDGKWYRLFVFENYAKISKVELKNRMLVVKNGALGSYLYTLIAFRYSEQLLRGRDTPVT